MTDIVEKMQSQVGDDVQRVFDHEALFKGAIAEITALRAELAEAQRDNAFIIEERDRTFALMLARAETAEARAYELAVAIMGGEDAPGYANSIPTDQLVELHRKNRLMDQKDCEVFSRENALREAADVAQSHYWPGCDEPNDPTARGHNSCAKGIEQAILALIDAPKEQQP